MNRTRRTNKDIPAILAAELEKERQATAKALEAVTSERFNRIYDSIEALNKNMTLKLNSIIEQTTKTNGSVKRLDERISSLEYWRWYILGGFSGITIVLGFIGWIIK